MAPLINAIVLSTDKIRKELTSESAHKKEEKKFIYDAMLLVAVMSRLKARKGDYSDADIDIYGKMKQLYEPVNERKRHAVIDTSQDSKINAEKIKSWIFREEE